MTPFKDKPAVLVSFLLGAAKEDVTDNDCYEVGASLSKFHASALDFSGVRKNNRNIDWISHKFNDLKSRLANSDKVIIELEIDYQKNIPKEELPTGIIHGDLFRDNVFFHENKLSAFIDFYYACNDHLILDLAIAINDWCSDSHGAIEKEKFNLLVSGYQSIRKLEAVELKYLKNSLRLSALRFWLSRLDAYHNALEWQNISIKDPDYFRKILLDRQRV